MRIKTILNKKTGKKAKTEIKTQKRIKDIKKSVKQISVFRKSTMEENEARRQKKIKEFIY